jgi:hypothetical protein
MQHIRSLILIAALAASSGSQARDFTFEPPRDGICQFPPQGAEDGWFEAHQLGQDEKAFTLQRELVADGMWGYAGNLAWSYENGIGVEPSEINAYMWYQVSALHPCLNYNVSLSVQLDESRRDELGKRMSSRHISKATRAAVMCLMSNLKVCDELPYPLKRPPSWWQFWR